MSRIIDRILLVTSEKLGCFFEATSESHVTKDIYIYFFYETEHHKVVVCLSVVHCSKHDINSSDRAGSNIDVVPYKNNIFNI